MVFLLDKMVIQLYYNLYISSFRPYLINKVKFLGQIRAVHRYFYKKSTKTVILSFLRALARVQTRTEKMSVSVLLKHQI